ncbi:hypothetical protein LA303_07765 [Candidatus Sulfidibacterium hydrothermale]|uniref:hypothetical protein n=1 Tax=Candidatus Sulfidibacterium hydrothermale TaxID=2875962 RepID=UPI001F0B2172|nr:hypothetical protein [Candidatus Sulfidibacterium hydrothermale]UBM61319.1 hypothetical protein LA303_07765 [Candidatus Sulfidibacterium hydrothermale]
MTTINQKQVRLLYEATKQLNKVLTVRNLLLSALFSTILVLLIDFLYDLRIIVFIIYLTVFTYISYKLIFKYKFSRLKNRLDPTPDYDQLITQDYINIKLGKQKLRLYLKDCHYYISSDFVFVFKTYKLMAIFSIEKIKQTTLLEDFLKRFKKQKKVSLLAVVTLIVIAISFTWKISLTEMNRTFLLKNNNYIVLKIVKGDSVLYQANNSYVVKLVNNQINDNNIGVEKEDVEIYIRLEPFKRIRVMYLILNNISDKNIDSLSKRILGLYSYQIEDNRITLYKSSDNIRIIVKIEEDNPAPNNGYTSCRKKC